MSVIGNDSRVLQNNPNADPYDSVVAVDGRGAGGRPLPGSGVIIGPDHVLTAGHVVFDGVTVQGARATLGVNVPALAPNANTGRPLAILSQSDDNIARTGITFPDGYNQTPTADHDIALLRLNQSARVTDTNRHMGIVAFMDPDDADGIDIETAGYPGQINPGSNSANAGTVVYTAPDGTQLTQAVLMYSASGTVASVANSGRFYYSRDVDTEGGQSGSGVWSTLQGILDGNTTQYVAGVHTNGVSGVLSRSAFFNSGQLITKNVYDNIVTRMGTDSGTANAATLPENVVVGTDSTFFNLIGGDDEIEGSYRREHILGRGGDDTIRGAGADDRIDGGEGVDQALYAGRFQDFSFTRNADGSIRFTDNLTSDGLDEGTDRLSDVEFAIFEKANPNDNEVFIVPLPVEDGPLVDTSADITDSQGDTVGALTLETPSWMFDGDVDYTFTIGGSALGTLYNFAYIIDVSGSMGSFVNGSQTQLDVAQEAYETLTRNLINTSVASVSQFAVVPFNHGASLTANLDAQGAINAINSLTSSGGTSFGPPLATAENWFDSINAQNATNIAFFLSDGQGSGASTSLQQLDDGTPVEVRAFGIGNFTDINALNVIDSDTAVQLNNPTDLIDAFQVSGVSRDVITRIDVKLDGTVVDTILPARLVDGELGLRVTGSVDGLEVSREAENRIAFEVVFNDGRPNATVETVVTTGQDEIIRDTANGTKVVQFGVAQTSFLGSILGSAEAVINANDLANEITDGAGDDEINANGGDDLIILSGGGSNVVDGGAGTDTVRFGVTEAAAGGISKVGDVVNVGSNSLLNVEFIEFTDRQISTATLQENFVASVNATSLTRDENAGPGARTATFEVTLNNPVATATTIDFRIVGGTATAGDDFTGANESVVIATGQRTASFDLTIVDDTLVEGNETVRVDIDLPGSVRFEDGSSTKRVGVVIADDDTLLAIANTGFSSTPEGDSGTTAVTMTVDRLGNTDGSLSVDFSLAGIGTTPANAADFVGGVLPSGTVNFVNGQVSAEFTINVRGDAEEEDDESFEITFSNPTQNVSIPNPVTFTVLNDDSPVDDGDIGADTSTTGRISVGGTVTSEIQPGNADKDWFRTELVAGRQYQIDQEGSATGAGTLVDPYLRGVRDNTGAQFSPVLRDDDAGTGLNSQLVFVAPYTGTYYLEAGSYGPAHAGSYELSLTEVTGSTDIGADTSTTGRITVGGTVTSEIQPGNADKDWFRTELVAGRQYQIDQEGSATGAGTLFDPYLRGVRDNTGSQFSPVLRDDDAGTGLNSQLVFVAPYTGTYYLEAGSYGPSDAGSYRLSVTQVGVNTLANSGEGDVFDGDKGGDNLSISDIAFQDLIDGTGSSAASLESSSIALNLPSIPDTLIQGDEQIELDGGNGAILNLLELAGMSDNSNLLTLAADSTSSGSTEFNAYSVPEFNFGGFVENPDNFRTFDAEDDAVQGNLLIG